MTANDLLLLRDVAGVTLSPDGEYVAFQVHQADLKVNGYRSSWFVTDRRSGQHLVEVGRGGEPRWPSVGLWLVLPPAWSPNSRFLVYAAVGADGVQLWLASRDGSIQKQLSHNPADIRKYAWAPDGDKIYFVVGMTRADQAQAAKRRALEGVLLDKSVFALHGEPRLDVPWWQQDTRDPGRDENLVRESPTTWTFDMSARTERLATPAEQAEASQQLSPPARREDREISGIFGIARSPSGRAVAYVADPYARTSNDHLYGAVYTRVSEGAPARLGSTFVRDGSEQLWWAKGERELLLLRGRGYSEDGTVIEAVPVNGDAVRTVFATPDVLHDCSVDAAGTVAACIREAATTPPDVAILDLVNGTLRTLTRLNPEFQAVQLAPAERLAWVNRYGDSSYAHLVRPLNYTPGRRYPLVITTYGFRGFLRGGTGDEYPIQLFAANGFAVLCFSRPRIYLSVGAQRPFEQIALEWWSPQASIEAILDSLSSNGVVDSTRVGITGLSAGARIVMFGISHSNRFRAAIASSNDDTDPMTWYLAYNHGSYHELLITAYGLDQPEGQHAQEVSPALNADRIHTPLLINAAGYEFLGSMELYAAIRERHRPMELWIYPNELHIKWQPQHRRRIYERNIDWLNFWLRDVEDQDPRKRDQYARWRNLREEWKTSMNRRPDAQQGPQH